MKFYSGEALVQKVLAAGVTGEVVLKARSVLIISDQAPAIKLSLSEGAKLLVWGDVYGVHRSNGEVSPLSGGADNDQLLKVVAEKAKDIKELVRGLEGRFMGVLIRSEKDIVLFADVYNRKDIFYSRKDGRLIAASDLKAIVAFEPPQAYDQESLVNLFNVYGNYTPKKHTIYSGISRLGVGEYLQYKDEKASVGQIPFEPLSTQAYGPDQLKEYSRLMHSSVELRSKAKDNWLSLSSGWDSSTILALLSKIRGPENIRAVISRVKFSNNPGVINQFEVDRAKKIAEFFGVRMDVLEIDYTKPGLEEEWQRIAAPLKANHLYSMGNQEYLALAEVVSKSNAGGPLFNGEISDGAHNLGFAQQATFLDHPDLSFREYGDKMLAYLFGPSFFERAIKGEEKKDLVYNLFRSRAEGTAFDDTASMDVSSRKARFIESFFISGQRIPFASLSNNAMFTDKGRTSYGATMRKEYFADFMKTGTSETLYAWFLHLYNSFHWQGGTVKGPAHSAEHFGLSMSMPFWDSRIQAFLSAMPESWGRGLDLNPTKYPLKWMLKNELRYPHHLQTGPHSYLYDIDPNWSGDADILYGALARPYFKDVIKKYQYEAVLKDSHFDLAYLRQLVDGYVQDKRVSGQDRSNLKSLITMSLVGCID